MTGLGVNRLVVSKILNDTEHKVASICDRHPYDREKREALGRVAGEAAPEVTRRGGCLVSTLLPCIAGSG